MDKLTPTQVWSLPDFTIQQYIQSRGYQSNSYINDRLVATQLLAREGFLDSDVDFANDYIKSKYQSVGDRLDLMTNQFDFITSINKDSQLQNFDDIRGRSGSRSFKTDYEIISELGRGLRGTVYKGLDIKNKREVAIKKVIDNDKSRKEIDSHRKVNNLSYVPRLYDYFVQDENGTSYIYMVQELIEGTVLHKTWRNNRNWDFNWMTIYHALKIVKDLHSHGYYHGDLHLGNFMWTDNQLYLIDFDALVDSSEKIQSARDRYDKGLINSYNLREELEEINDGYCNDYNDLISRKNLSRLGDCYSFANNNQGLEKYTELVEFRTKNTCRQTGTPDKNYTDYIDILISKYEELDKSTFASLLDGYDSE